MDQPKRVLAAIKLRSERARARWAFFDVVMGTFKRYSADDGGSYAAALTYYTFFSIFPLLLFAGAVVGYLASGNETLQRDLIDGGLKTVPIIKDALSPEGLKTIQDNRSGLALTGTLLALYSGSGVIVALEHALNKIARIHHEPGFLAKRLRSLRWLAILGLGAIASLGLSIVTGFAPGPLATILALAGGLAINTGLFATAFTFLPAGTRSFREALPGAIVAAVGFELLKVGGAAYIARGETARNDTFGTFAAAAALLLASYLIAQIVLLAAEVNAVLAERRDSRQALPTN